MNDKVIMLVEDNPNDEKLTLRALAKNSITNDIVVARDGVEALDYLFGTGKYALVPDRPMPVVILLDLKLPKVDGLEVLRCLRADPRTKSLPVVVLTTSNEQRDIFESYNLYANSYVRKPVNFDAFNDAVKNMGLYWLLINEPPPVLAAQSGGV